MADRRLPMPVDRALDVSADEARVQRTWRGVQRLRALRRARREQRWLAPAAAAALVVLGFVGWQVALELGGGSDAGPLRVADGSAVGTLVVPAGSPERTVRFADGSSVRLAPDTRVETLANGRDRFSLRLARGAVTCHVRPGGPRRWTIEAGLAQVEVVGTRFGVERSGDAVRVSVSQGAVLVRSARLPDGVRRLEAGERVLLEASPSASGSASDGGEGLRGVRSRPADESGADESGADESGADTTASAAAPVADEAGDDTARDDKAGGAAAPRGPDWRAFAREGAYERAYAALGTRGVEGAAARASADELLALADVARLSGHPEEAVAPLERLLGEHASDSRAPLAGFTLGRLHMDHLGRPRLAAEVFGRALAMGLPQDLVGPALARKALCLARTGDADGAQLAAADYLSRFPNGDRTRAMRELVGGR